MGLSQTQVAALLRLKVARVSNWFQGRNMPRSAEKSALARALGVNLQWLMEGTGPIELNSKPEDAVLQEAVAEHGVEVRQVPIISWAHAGEAASYEALPKHWHGTVATTSRDRRAFALTIEGDSMEPKFYQGDCVILEPTAEPRNGHPVVAKYVDDAVQLRIYHKLPSGKIRLAPLNPVYPVEERARKDFHWIFPVCGLYRKV